MQILHCIFDTGDLKMRIAVLKKDRCKPNNCGNYLCIKVCPVNRSGNECIVEAEDKKPLISESLCVGCGICVNKCPFEAIAITNLPEEAGILTHQYGPNDFRVYGLPIPKQGSVVGILGENGTGKTTTIKILNGQLIPNLGSDNTDLDNVIEKYRGNEVQNFLEQLKEKEVTSVLKPQHVDKIREILSGKVSEILKKNSIPKQISSDFELEKCADRDIKNLSGGELQRLAIAVALGKKANLYLFDEPTSYLDIRQRLDTAKKIRNLSKDKMVVVIEHDLVVLDYLSDYIHITYGQPAVYGIISQIKSSRVGINEYINGHMRNENIKFRNTEIRFEEKALSRFKGKKPTIQYPRIKKSYKGFDLDAEAGQLFEGEVVGVVGPNATGKTTFVKILSGVEKNDLEQIDLKISVSYKPQYIETSKDTVRELLTKTTEDFYKSFYERSILIPFGLKPLLDKNVEELSGGELQRLAIAKCLSKNADLYLFDEPSAYLDVEQRLITAKTIRDWMENKKKSALVVDHDIAFIDYVSDRIMVFSGEPSLNGAGSKALDLRDGMNIFLKEMDITFRRDKETKRPRANKPDSQLDKEQKEKGEYYYS